MWLTCIRARLCIPPCDRDRLYAGTNISNVRENLYFVTDSGRNHVEQRAGQYNARDNVRQLYFKYSGIFKNIPKQPPWTDVHLGHQELCIPKLWPMTKKEVFINIQPAKLMYYTYIHVFLDYVYSTYIRIYIFWSIFELEKWWSCTLPFIQRTSTGSQSRDGS